MFRNKSESLSVSLTTYKTIKPHLPADIVKIVSEYEQEIPQSQTADKPMAPRGRATQHSRETRKANQAKQPALFSPSR